jgi:hypothetical protein
MTGIHRRRRRRLLNASVGTAASVTSTSTATHGGAWSTPWGGTLVTTGKSLEIDVSANFVIASGSIDVVLHVLIGGTCVYEDSMKATHAAVGRKMTGSTILTGLAAGSYSVAVQAQLASAGTVFLGSPITSPSYLRISEVA